MKIFLLFYMCHFAMGLTHRYKITVFLHLLILMARIHSTVTSTYSINQSCVENTAPVLYAFEFGKQLLIHDSVLFCTLFSDDANCTTYCWLPDRNLAWRLCQYWCSWARSNIILHGGLKKGDRIEEWWLKNCGYATVHDEREQEVSFIVSAAC